MVLSYRAALVNRTLIATRNSGRSLYFGPAAALGAPLFRRVQRTLRTELLNACRDRDRLRLDSAAQPIGDNARLGAPFGWAEKARIWINRTTLGFDANETGPSCL